MLILYYLILEIFPGVPKKKKKENFCMNKLILAITSCPVGVATTYVAAKQLTKAAKDLNYEIKVETQGLRGVENKLTDQEIEKAEVIIIASSIQVDIKRFANKKIYEVDLNQVVKNPKEVILDALNKATLYKTKLELKDQGKFKNSLMKHLLNGVSYMVPFIILGGIFLALSIGLMKSIGNEDNPILKAMLKIGESSFALMIPILAGYIAYSIAGKSALAPSMVVTFLANNKNFFYHYK
ncbi:MAG: PTS fructose transporter subunit IIB, partial [Mycoplasma sp.]|nr:PTS fructose transporter subunit IIB [Mycoplasma sp.]